MSSHAHTRSQGHQTILERISGVREAVSPSLQANFASGELVLTAAPALAQSGLLGLTLPPQYGGMGGNYHDLARCCIELGRIDLSLQISVTVHLALSAMTILQWGTPEQRDRWLPDLAGGRARATFALTEPNAGSDVAALTTRASPVLDGFRISGEKSWISDTAVATHFVIFATVDPTLRHRGITGFFLSRSAPGITRTEISGKLGIRAGSTGSIVCDNVEVPTAAALGEVGEGFTIALNALENGLFTVACGALGIIRECLSITQAMITAHPISRADQLTRNSLASMVAIEQRVTALIEQAAGRKNTGAPSQQLTGLAKWIAATGALAAADAALNIAVRLGDHHRDVLERHRRNAQGAVIYGGTTQVHESMQGAFATGLRTERPSRRPALSAAQLSGQRPLDVC